jgi:hypothetical protein
MYPNEFSILSPFYINDNSHVKNRNTKNSCKVYILNLKYLYFACRSENKFFLHIIPRNICLIRVKHKENRNRKLLCSYLHTT